MKEAKNVIVANSNQLRFMFRVIPLVILQNCFEYLFKMSYLFGKFIIMNE